MSQRTRTITWFPDSFPWFGTILILWNLLLIFPFIKNPDVTVAICACHFAHFSYFVYLIILIVIFPTNFKCWRGSNILLHYDLTPHGLMMDIVLLTLYCICMKMCAVWNHAQRNQWHCCGFWEGKKTGCGWQSVLSAHILFVWLKMTRS
jgi:hypothetical protein